MTNALVVRKPLTPDTWQMISSIAPAMHRSRLLGVNSPEQAMAIMLKGYELGLGLTASFEFIDIIQGKPSLKPRGMLALLHNHPDCAEIKVQDLTDKSGTPTACTVYMRRENGFEYTVTFTMDDAKKAGLVKADSGWAKYPANMLRWRALGFCADVVFPDVLGGLKRSDELGADLDEEGDVIEGSWSSASADEAVGEVVYTELLETLTERYGPDALMEAAGGTIPGTAEELEVVALQLASEEEE